MEELTQKQDNILSFIESHVRRHSVSPSFQQIQEHFGFASPHAATKHVQAIIRKGFLKARRGAKRNEHRGLIPLRPLGNQVPLLGRIAAGAPIEAIENIETNMDLSSLGMDNTRKELFALRVKGASMVNAHILDGDIVVIQKQPMVKSTDIAAVLWNNEATLKYVRHAGRNILLVPANDAMQPITVTAQATSSFSILGKVVMVLRNM